MSRVILKDDTNFEKVYNAYITNGNAPLQKFTGVGGSGDGYGFSEGDVISLPDDLNKAMLAITIPNSTRKAEALLCKVTSRTGAVRYQPFFVKSMAKRTRVLKFDDAGNVIDEIPTKPSGSAAEWWQSMAGHDNHEIVQELLAKDKDIKITKATPEKTYRFGTPEIINTIVYTYDFV